jgi:hypothetical protein
MTQPTRRDDHASHDLLIIAAGADRDADDATRAAADRQAAECADCSELSADLRSIASGLRELPRSIPVPASRDFRISPDQADRLRRWSGLRRLLRPFGAGSAPSLRPLATAFTTLGIAGLLFTVLLPGFLNVGSGGASPALAPAAIGAGATEQSNDKSLLSAPSPGLPAAGATSAPAEVSGPGAATAAPASSTASDAFNSARSAAPTAQAAPAPVVAESPASPWSFVTVLSLALLGIGVALLLLRLVANRLFS